MMTILVSPPCLFQYEIILGTMVFDVGNVEVILGSTQWHPIFESCHWEGLLYFPLVGCEDFSIGHKSATWMCSKQILHGKTMFA